MAGEEGIEPSSSVLPARRGTLLFIELSQLLAGVEGIEPSSLVLETSVLPLNYTPTKKCEKQCALAGGETDVLPLNYSPTIRRPVNRII